MVLVNHAASGRVFNEWMFRETTFHQMRVAISWPRRRGGLPTQTVEASDPSLFIMEVL